MKDQHEGQGAAKLASERHGGGALGEVRERVEGLFVARRRLAVGSARLTSLPHLPAVAHRLLPHRPPNGVVGEPLGVLGKAISVKGFDRLDKPRVKLAPPLLQQAAVGHLVGQRMLEGVLGLWEQAHLVQKLRGPETREGHPHRGVVRLGDRLEQRQRHIPAEHRGDLNEPLVFRRQAVNARGQDGLRGGRNGESLRHRRQPVGAALPDQRPGLDETLHALFEKEGVALGAGDQDRPEREDRRIGAQQGLKELVGAGGSQRIDAELAVIGLAIPAVAEFRAVAYEQEQLRRRQAVHEAVQERLRHAVDPVQVLEDQHQRLHLALPQNQAAQAIEHPLPPLRGVQALPPRILHRHVEHPEERGEATLQCSVQREQLAGVRIRTGTPAVRRIPAAHSLTLSCIRSAA
jgi:hypothetical protein